MIEPCRMVYTLRMAFPIDVLHLDGEGRVVRVVANLPVWRFGPLRVGHTSVSPPTGYMHPHRHLARTRR